MACLRRNLGKIKVENVTAQIINGAWISWKWQRNTAVKILILGWWTVAQNCPLKSEIWSVAVGLSETTVAPEVLSLERYLLLISRAAIDRVSICYRLAAWPAKCHHDGSCSSSENKNQCGRINRWIDLVYAHTTVHLSLTPTSCSTMLWTNGISAAVTGSKERLRLPFTMPVKTVKVMSTIFILLKTGI